MSDTAHNGARDAGRPPRRSRATPRAAMVVIGCALALAGCEGKSMRDLNQYVEGVLARPGGRIEELPPIEPYTAYTYEGSEIDPFAPFYQEEAPEQTTAQAQTGPRPDFDRNREELEQYALDSLRMKGTLEQQGSTWAIVKSPDELIHRLAVGNYVGRNHGKIIGIFEDRIELKEIVSDGQGGWTERDAALALAE